MNEWLEAAHAVLEPYPWAYTVLALSAVLLAAWLANWITKHVLLRGLRRLLQAVPFAAQSSGVRLQVIPRLANVVPALVVYAGLEVVPGLPEQVVKVVRALCDAFMVLTVALAIGKLLDVLAEVYQQRADNRNRPIKGYMQVVKIVVFALATLSIVATLAGVPFVHLVTGLGAASAVLMLIFQDTILSFVASAQISGDGRVRVGDWIEMPGQNADGDVVDIALHTVTVQNWDKTITTIPTRKLISESFKNWRGMQQSGGRRVKRSLYLDQNSVHFLTPKEHERLSHIALLDDYLQTKRVDITQWNAQLAPDSSETVNQRRLTNLGTFRAYVECYLRSHPGIHQGMTLMVRQLQPTATGLPLEIYCFTNTVVWAQYEAIQSDIFDHLLAILPEFDLNLFQEPSGNDVRTAPMFAAGAL